MTNETLATNATSQTTTIQGEQPTPFVNSSSSTNSHSSVARTVLMAYTALVMATASSLQNHSSPHMLRNDSSTVKSNRGRKDNSTNIEEDVEEMYNRLLKMVNTYNSEYEDGYISELAKAVVQLVNQHGDSVIVALNALVKTSSDVDSTAELIKWVGYMEDTNTVVSRASMASNQIFHTSPRIRDASALLLADLLLPSTKEVISLASQGETKAHIKYTLEHALSAMK